MHIAGGNIDVEAGLNSTDGVPPCNIYAVCGISSFLLNVILLSLLVVQITYPDTFVRDDTHVTNKEFYAGTRATSGYPSVSNSSAEIMNTSTPSSSPSLSLSLSQLSKANSPDNEQKLLDSALKGDTTLLLSSKNSAAQSLNFLAINGTIRRIPDDPDNTTLKSIASVRVVQKWLHVENSTLSKFRVGKDIPELLTRNPDEIIMSYLTLQRIFQSDIIDLLEPIQMLRGEADESFVNPCVIKWRDKYNIMSSAGVHENLKFYLLDANYKVTETLKLVGANRMPQVEDTRLWFMEKTPDLLYAVFTIAATMPYQVGLAVFNLSFNHSDPFNVNNANNIPYLNLSVVARIVPPGKEEHQSQKNWSPFDYNGELHFVQSINPLQIFKISLSTLMDGKVFAENVSTASHVDTYWPFPQFHGGSPALKIQNCCYMSFFHSKEWLPSASVATYFAGAYTFSLKPPFHLLRVSAFPIIDDSLYTGRWVPFRNRHLDYVVFPMCYDIALSKVENSISNTIYLSTGHQDDEGVEFTMEFQRLWKTLYPVQSSNTFNESRFFRYQY